jgi:hypothetical protein
VSGWLWAVSCKYCNPINKSSIAQELLAIKSIGYVEMMQLVCASYGRRRTQPVQTGCQRKHPTTVISHSDSILAGGRWAPIHRVRCIGCTSRRNYDTAQRVSISLLCTRCCSISYIRPLPAKPAHTNSLTPIDTFRSRVLLILAYPTDKVSSIPSCTCPGGPRTHRRTRYRRGE